jgi:hypothetical protein
MRQKSDQVHEKITEMMVNVNEIRDKLNMARDERKSWMVDHNAAVKSEMKTGAESDDVADALLSSLQSQGSVTFGGTAKGDAQGTFKKGGKSSKKKSMRRIDMNATRRR